ncbi:diacylglycerol/lipid kinase family protein [Thermohalobacter berrensis]|uniref:DAGKc domain-containing protein n=1 Tax=Thermohalobacter berrensis TaxID=99594 RepID=A0A419T2K4_9FIRM|nr:diacylglycerol kinase family protein [Thermohalobacter berrensis]RKD31671.1 hypothetical protein BET03_12295 [Thermohalobacter berrensis]
MKVLFVINPIAGRHRSQSIIPIIKEKMKNKDIEYKIITTKAPKDAVSITKYGLKSGFNIITAVGGDGTINEVATGILSVGHGTLGIIQGGTGNDLAKTLNIPKEPHKAIDLILKGKTKVIDIGSVNGRPFLNVASIGVDSQIAQNIENIKKYFRGKTAYTLGFLKTIFSYKHKKLKVKVNNNIIDRKVLLIAIGNSKYYGGGMEICPDSIIDDGNFDICIVNEMPKYKVVTLFPSVFKGEHLKYKKYVEYFRVKSLEIEVLDKAYLNLDGETYPISEKLLFSIYNKKLNVICN